MEKPLVEGELGSEAVYELKWEEGELKLTFGYDGKGIDAGVYVNLGGEYFLDKLAAAIPGELDDSVINLIKAAMK